MRYLVSAAALATLALPQVAQACLYTQQPEEVGHSSGQYFAKEMLAAATYADLVLVEDDGTRAMDARPTGIITLRTIARFKGNSADRFTVFGSPLTLSPEKRGYSTRPCSTLPARPGRSHHSAIWKSVRPCCSREPPAIRRRRPLVSQVAVLLL